MNQPARTVRYHWVLTLTGQIDGQQATVGDHGVCELTPGQSRYEVCTEIVRTLLGEVLASAGKPMTAHNIVNFDLQPDRVGQ